MNTLATRSVRGMIPSILIRGFASTSDSHHKIVIIGAGTAGLAMASHLTKANQKGAIIDPAQHHYYQPGWTLVGGGIFKKEDTQRPLAPLVPRGFDLISSSVVEVQPDSNTIVTSSGKIRYDYLVVCAGIQINWDSVPGLKEALGKEGVSSNYSYQHVDKTWEFLSGFRGGNALFTQPSSPIKCAGAPQKIMYLGEEQFRSSGVRQNTNVKFLSGMGSIFGVKKYADSLTNVCKSRNIETHFQHNLVELRADKREAVFRTADGSDRVEKYDFIHVTPPMGPPEFIKQSPLADKTLGWVDVNKDTCQHVRYPNVFAVGDCSSAPKSRTAAAISQEAPVASKNLVSLINGRPLEAVYSGYASCPLVTGKGKLILAEFDYSMQPRETFGSLINQANESAPMYYLKTHVLPQLYWQGLLKGHWNSFSDYKASPSPPTPK